MFRVFSNTLMTLNTSKTHSLPDADDWQEIQGFKQFPLLPSTRKAFQQLMQKTSLSFDGLAAIAEQDPAICLHMLLHIQQRNPASLDQINTASGCISLLGMEEVVKLVKQLPTLDFFPKSRSERNYMAQLNTATLAGKIAAGWANSKPGLNPHQAHWSAMLASAPLWPWLLQQVSASQKMFNSMSRGKDLIPALQLGFGKLSKSRLALWRRLAEGLALPHTCQSLWQRECWPKHEEWQVLRTEKLKTIEGHRTLKHQCQQPEMLIYLANALAIHYQIGAYRSKTNRWLSLSAHFLNCDPQQLHHTIVSLNLQLARQGRRLSAINSLLSPTNTAVPEGLVYFCEKEPAEFKMERDKPKAIKPKDYQPEGTKPKAVKLEDSNPQERKINHVKLKQLIQQLNDVPESFGEWHELMHSVLKGITEGIGLKHAYIMVQNKSGSAAKVYYQQGLADTDPMRQFSIGLDKVSVFKKMLEKPASLMITDQNRKKMLRGLPDHQQKSLPEQFMMMSLFSNERPIGIIFADIGKISDHQPMQPSEYMAFKSLCFAASKSLGKLAQISKKKSNTQTTKLNKRQA